MPDEKDPKAHISGLEEIARTIRDGAEKMIHHAIETAREVASLRGSGGQQGGTSQAEDQSTDIQLRLGRMNRQIDELEARADRLLAAS